MGLNSVSEVKHQSINTRLSIESSVWQKKVLLATADISLFLVFLFFYHKIQLNHLSFFDFLHQQATRIPYGIAIFWLLSVIFNFYDLNYVNKTRKVLPLSFFIGITCTSLYIFIPFITPVWPSQSLPILIFIFGFTSSLIIWRVFYASVIHTNIFVKNFILLTSSTVSNTMLRRVKTSIEGNDFDNGLKILRTYRIPENKKDMTQLSRTIDRMASKKRIDQIIVLDLDQGNFSESLNTVFVRALRYGVHVKTYFELFEEINEALPLRFAGSQFYSILPVSKYNSNYIYLLWQKGLNISSSLIGLAFMIALTPLILIFNLFFNRGPLFYRQYRVGKGGKEIEITKFRSMIVEAERHGAKMSEKGDLRITSFGHILRKTRIDELPQFWSVLKGEMSVIGPRPERKIFIDELVKKIPLYDSRHLIRPGITGWAQVKCDYGENAEDSLKKLEYDLYYVKNRSVTLDIRIIFKTINTIIFYKGQ